MLKRTPFYLLLLPVFFVLNAFNYYYDFVPIYEAAVLILAYCSAAVLIAGVAWMYYRNIRKAAFVSFIIMSFQLFFGYGSSLIFRIISYHYYPGYGFIIPFCLLLLLGIVIIVKRINKPFYRTTLFLNLLLLLFIVIDAARLVMTVRKSAPATIAGLQSCDTCNKPDVYFIILDEYAGNAALKEKFGYDNTPFIEELSTRGFHVTANSTSNYNTTPYAVASMLNMDYLDISPSIQHADLFHCYRRIRENAVVNFFQTNDYKLYNYSFFKIDDQPALGPEYFLPRGSSLVTSQTFTTRLYKHTLKNVERVYNGIRDNIDNFINRTKHISGETTSQPKFVYTHLLMPHSPYFFDSLGHWTGIDTLTKAKGLDTEKLKALYSSYLKYCNKRILELTDHIIAHSSTPPLIILTGDHGYRDQSDKQKDLEYINLQAVLLPSHNYQYFYDHLSSVNLFRVVLNTEFGQKLPLLIDNIVYLKE